MSSFITFKACLILPAMFLFVLAHVSHAYSPHVKRRVCTVYSRNDPCIDDVPEIYDAFQECGNTGRIVLWAEDTFNIRSPIDLSRCRRCEFSINGIMKLSTDLGYWSKHSTVFRIANTSNIVITSESAGIIDAGSFGGTAQTGKGRLPDLFRVSNGSNQVYIRNLIIQNAPGTIFHIDGSSAVRIEGIDVQSTSATGFLIENSQHICLWRSAIRASSSCVAIAPSTSNIQVEEVNCLGNATADPASNGIELRFAVGGRAETIRNIFVKTFRAIGRMNAVAFVFAQNNGTSIAQVQNATFTDINIGPDNRQAVQIGRHSAKLAAQDITFRGFVGTSEVNSDLTCGNPGDVCELKREGWNVTVKG